MHNVPSSAILCVTAIVAAASIGGFAMMAIKTENASGYHTVTKSDYVTNNAMDSMFTDYDGKVVHGTEIVQMLKNQMYDEIGIAVYNGSTWTNFGYPQ